CGGACWEKAMVALKAMGMVHAARNREAKETSWEWDGALVRDRDRRARNRLCGCYRRGRQECMEDCLDLTAGKNNRASFDSLRCDSVAQEPGVS
ncbi:MAG TPA: hypothetical protein VGJ21_02570, partial [Terracidiphilus sp.]